MKKILLILLAVFVLGVGFTYNINLPSSYSICPGPALTKSYVFDSSGISVGTSTVSALLGIMAAALSFGVWTSVALGLTSIVTTAFPKKIKVNEKYREAVGCPQLMKYIEQIVYDYKTGKKIASATSEKILFNGVKNSPANPPMCRQYGY